MLENIDVETIINYFASRNAQRLFFINICMFNLKFDVFILILKNMLFVKSNKNYHLQAKKIYYLHLKL